MVFRAAGWQLSPDEYACGPAVGNRADLGSGCRAACGVGCSHSLVINFEASVIWSSDPIDSASQTRSEGQAITPTTHTSSTAGQYLSWLWEDHQSGAKPLRKLCCYDRNRTFCEGRAHWACSGAQSRSSCE